MVECWIYTLCLRGEENNECTPLWVYGTCLSQVVGEDLEVERDQVDLINGRCVAGHNTKLYEIPVKLTVENQ